MTTNHHTPITAGAVADAATVNTPLGELDQAITNAAGAEYVIDDQIGQYTYPNDSSVPAPADAATYGIDSLPNAFVIVQATNGDVYLKWNGTTFVYKGFRELATIDERTFVVDELNYLNDLYANDGSIPSGLNAATYGLDTTGGRLKIEYRNGYLQLEYVVSGTLWNYINFEEKTTPHIFESPYDPNSTDNDGLQLDPATVAGQIYVVNRGLETPQIIGHWVFDDDSGIWLEIGNDVLVTDPSWVYVTPENGTSDVSISSPSITLVFDQAMQEETIAASLSLRDPQNNVVNGTWQTFDEKSFNFFPAVDLSSNVEYTLRIESTATSKTGRGVTNFGVITTFTTETVVTSLVCNGTRTCYADPLADITVIDYNGLQTWDAGNPDSNGLDVALQDGIATLITNFGGGGKDVTIDKPVDTSTAGASRIAFQSQAANYTAGSIRMMRTSLDASGEVLEITYAFDTPIDLMWYVHVFEVNQTLTVTTDGTINISGIVGSGGSFSGNKTNTGIMSSGSVGSGGIENTEYYLHQVQNITLRHESTDPGGGSVIIEWAEANNVETYSECSNPSQVVRVSDLSIVTLPSSAIEIPCSQIGL